MIYIKGGKYYYKHYKNGKKIRISKKEYMKKTNKKGGNNKILFEFKKKLINFNERRLKESYHSKIKNEIKKEKTQQIGLIKNIELFGNFLADIFKEEDYNPNCIQNFSLKEMDSKNSVMIGGIFAIQFIRFNRHNIYLFHEIHQFNQEEIMKLHQSNKIVFMIEDIVKGMLQTGFKTNYFHENFKYNRLLNNSNNNTRLDSMEKNRTAKKELKKYKIKGYESFYKTGLPYFKRYILRPKDIPKKYKNVQFHMTDIRYTNNYLIWKLLRSGNSDSNLELNMIFKYYLNTTSIIKFFLNVYLTSKNFIGDMRKIFDNNMSDKNMTNMNITDLLFDNTGSDIINLENGQSMHLIGYEIENSGYKDLILEYLNSRIDKFLSTFEGMREEMFRSTGNKYFNTIIDDTIKMILNNHFNVGEMLILVKDGDPINISIDTMLDFFANDYREENEMNIEDFDIDADTDIFTTILSGVCSRYLSDLMNDTYTLSRLLQNLDGKEMTITYGGSDHPKFIYDFFKWYKYYKGKNGIQLKCYGKLQELDKGYEAHMSLNIDEFNSIFQSFMPKIEEKKLKRIKEDKNITYGIKEGELYYSGNSNNNNNNNLFVPRKQSESPLRVPITKPSKKKRNKFTTKNVAAQKQKLGRSRVIP